MRHVATMEVEHGARDLRELASHLATLPLHARNGESVVGRRLMPHPRDDRRLRALAHRDALRSRDRSAPDRRRMRGDLVRHHLAEQPPLVREAQEPEHLLLERDDIRSLRPLATCDVRDALLRVAHRRSLRLDRGAHLLDVRTWRPQPLRERLSTALLEDHPRRSRELHATRQRRIAGRQTDPVRRRRQPRAIRREEHARIGRWSEHERADAFDHRARI